MGKWSNYLKSKRKRSNPLPAVNQSVANVQKLLNSVNADVVREGIKQLTQFLSPSSLSLEQWKAIKRRLKELTTSESTIPSIPELAYSAYLRFKAVRARKNPSKSLRRKVFQHRHYGEL